MEYNLDAMTRDELWEFFKTCVKSPEEIIDMNMYSADAVITMLKTYSFNKMCAMDFRVNGYIDKAVKLEALCDDIYNGFPEEVRW